MNTGLLHNRDFGLLWLSQVISTLGEVLYLAVVMVVVFERTGSALQTVGVTIASTLPPFLFGPFAGVAVDRYPRKWVMVTINLLRAALIGLLPLFVHGEDVNVLGIYATVGGLAAATTFYQPARQATLPSLVARGELVQANSLIMTTNQAGYAAGYGAGGILIVSVGFRTLLAVNMVSFIIAAVVVSLIVVPARPAEGFPGMGRRAPVMRSVVDGLKYLRAHPLARSLVTMESMEHVPHGVWSSPLMLAFTQYALGSSVEWWGYQNSAYFAGQLIGGLAAVYLASQLNRYPGWAIIWNTFLCSVLTTAYALSPNAAFAVVLSFMFGPGFAMRDVSQDSLLQATVDGDVLGRVYATRSMLANLLFMLGSAFFAWVADTFQVRWVFFIGAILYLGTAFYALSSNAIRRSRIEAEAIPAAVPSE